MRRARAVAVLGIVIGGAVGIISSTQTWLVATLAGAGADELDVAGAAAVAVLAPVSLAAMALGLALSIVGVVLRYVFGVLSVGAAVVLAVPTAQIVVLNPVSAVAPAVTAATGIAGADAVEALVEGIRATPWPAVTVAACLVLLVAGVFTVATARGWRRSGRRFRTETMTAGSPGTAAGPLDAFDSWDGLTKGEDPTASGRSPLD